jgi:hypothetical protein
MAPPSSLKDVYIEELSDLVSANVQMQKIMPEWLSKHPTKD